MFWNKIKQRLSNAELSMQDTHHCFRRVDTLIDGLRAEKRELAKQVSELTDRIRGLEYVNEQRDDCITERIRDIITSSGGFCEAVKLEFTDLEDGYAGRAVINWGYAHSDLDGTPTVFATQSTISFKHLDQVPYRVSRHVYNVLENARKSRESTKKRTK